MFECVMGSLILNLNPFLQVAFQVVADLRGESVSRTGALSECGLHGNSFPFISARVQKDYRLRWKFHVLPGSFSIPGGGHVLCGFHWSMLCERFLERGFGLVVAYHETGRPGALWHQWGHPDSEVRTGRLCFPSLGSTHQSVRWPSFEVLFTHLPQLGLQLRHFRFYGFWGWCQHFSRAIQRASDLHCVHWNGIVLSTRWGFAMNIEARKTKQYKQAKIFVLA